jgi:hypothetical protein
VVQPSANVIIDDLVFGERDLRTKLFIGKQQFLDPFERGFVGNPA